MLILESEFVDAVKDYPDVSGIGISVRNRAELFRMAANALKGVRQAKSAMYLNMHVLYQAQNNPELYDAISGADFCYCDSDGVRLMLSASGEGEVEKLTGAGFYKPLFGILQRYKPRVFLLGSTEDTLSKAKENLADDFPLVEVVGTHHGYFVPAEEEAIIDKINEAKPDILFVGMGTPLQELWLKKHKHRLNVRLAWAVGSLFAYMAGEVKRAPKFMLRANLEWLYRIACEPRRLYKRMVIECPSFLSAYFIGRLRLSWATARLLGFARKVRLVSSD